jgi:hypothetical protein
MNSFKDFLDDFKQNNPKDNSKKGFDRIIEELKDAIIGLKSVIVSPQKGASFSEKAIGQVQESARKDEEQFEVEKDAEFAEIKKVLNSIDATSTKQLQILSKREDQDNFESSQENEEKSSKIELDYEKKLFEISKEQLAIIKEIRDAIKPKVPGELEEQKAKPLDIFAADMSSKEPIKVSPIAERFKKDKPNVVVADTDSKTKKEGKLKKRFGGAKLGLAGLGIAGASYFGYRAFDEMGKEDLQEEFAEIDRKFQAGEISELEAKAEKQQLETEYKKELTQTMSEEGGAIGGALAGGALGAKIGSFAGPVGTIGGSIVGSVIGGIGGSELGKNAGNYFNSEEFKSLKENVSAKTSEYTKDLKEGFGKAKDYVQTDLLPDASKKVSSFIDSVKENLNIDNLRSNAAKGLDSLKNMIEPETMSNAAKIIGEQPGQYVDRLIKQADEVVSATTGEAKALVNNIVNNQSTNNFIPLKSTPRAEFTGSALDRYTDKLSKF